MIFVGLFACVLHRTAEISLGSIHIAISVQEEVDGPAGLVYGPIQLDPAAANLYICRVHPQVSANRIANALKHDQPCMFDPDRVDSRARDGRQH